MKRALFLELLDEETSIPRGGKNAFKSFDALTAMLDVRTVLAKKMEAAKASGQLTQEQYDQLVTLNRQHALPKV